MENRTPIAVLLIISVICKTTGTGVNHKPSLEPLDEVDSTTNATALERYRRLIPYMTYYLTQGVAGQQFAQPLFQGYNQYNPVNVVPNKLEAPQPRPMPLLNNGYVLRPLQQLYNPQLQAQQQLQAAQPQIQIQPQQLIQLKQLQPLGLARFANYQQPQILKNIAHLQQQSQILQNNAPLQQHLQQQQSQILQNNVPLQQLQQQQLQQQQQPHYPQLPSKPFMESDFKPMIKSQPTHQYLPKQPQYLLKERRPQQVTVLQPTQLNYPKSIAASYATPKPQQNQQTYTHLQRPVYLKAYQPHKALQQYLQEITPVTKIQPVSPNVYPVEHSVKTYTDHQVDAALRQEDHQVKEYTDAALRQLSQEDHKVKEYTDAVLRQLSQEQQVKETNQEEEQEKNEEEEQTDNSYTKYMSNNQRPNDDEVMTITQSQEIIVPQEPAQPDQSTQELTELLEGYKLSKTLPETITTANIGSSIRTLSQILKVLQRANALSTVSHPSEDSDDYATKAALPYSSTQTEASTPGRAGVDYPNYSEIPSTAFNCKDQRYKGFFGDPETNCQVWHYCDLNGGQASFLCPNGTIFSQVALTCDWWFNVKCAATPQLYVLNERLYKYILPQRPSFPEDFAGPLVDQYLTLKYHELEAKKKNATAKAKPTTTTESAPLPPNVDFLTLLSNEVKRNV